MRYTVTFLKLIPSREKLLACLTTLFLLVYGAPVLADASMQCPDGKSQALSKLENNSSKGLVPAAPVTTILPAESDAQIVVHRPFDWNHPNVFRVFERLDAKGQDWSQHQVIAIEPTPEKLVKKGYAPAGSQLLHVEIEAQPREPFFPFWRNRVFIITECTDGSLTSWAKVVAPVSRAYVSFISFPAILFIYVLAMMAVYRSRKDKSTSLLLKQKYPAVFGAKELSRWDFLNPIHLAANAFNQGSVQKLQVILFSFIVGGLVLSLVLRTGALASLSGTVVTLLGISGFGAAISQITYTSKTRLSFENWAWLHSKGILVEAEARGPQWKDLVLTNREFDVYKLQALVFSVAVAIALLSGGASNLEPVMNSN